MSVRVYIVSDYTHRYTENKQHASVFAVRFLLSYSIIHNIRETIEFSDNVYIVCVGVQKWKYFSFVKKA